MLYDDPFFLVVAAATLIVLGILVFGLGTFARGGEFNRRHANRIMRYRIAAQLVAVLLIVAFAIYRSKWGG